MTESVKQQPKPKVGALVGTLLRGHLPVEGAGNDNFANGWNAFSKDQTAFSGNHLILKDLTPDSYSGVASEIDIYGYTFDSKFMAAVLQRKT